MIVKILQMDLKCRCGEMVSHSTMKDKEAIPVFTASVKCSHCGSGYFIHIQEVLTDRVDTANGKIKPIVERDMS